LSWTTGYRRPGDRSARPHPSLREFLPFLLREATRSMETATAAALAEQGADWPVFALLTTLDHFGALSQTTLVEKAGVNRTTLSSVLADLEDEGLVTREPDLADRRRFSIPEVTALGQLDRRERDRVRVLLDRSLPRGYTGVMGLRF
jgi:MarR family transcriptional regulator, lower aerobic nicotinate degradation pathway regulator